MAVRQSAGDRRVQPQRLLDDVVHERRIGQDGGAVRRLDGQVPERRADAEGGVLEPGDEQEEAEVADLVLAVGPALDVALQEQRDEVVAPGMGAAVRDLGVEERVQRVGRGEDLLLRGAVDAAVDQRVRPGPERLVALDAQAAA